MPGKPASAAAAGGRARSPASSSAASAARALRTLWRAGHRAASSSAGPGPSASKRTTSAGRRRDRIELGVRAAAPAPAAPGEARETPRSSSAREPQREWWSSSTFVTTATSGASSRKLPSDSSASATDPLALAPAGVRGRAAGPGARQLAAEEEGGVGADRPQRVDEHRRRWSSCRGCRRRRSAACSAQSSASSSPRWITRWPRSRARASSGLSSRDRGRDDDLGARRDGVGVVADARLEPGRAQALQVGALGAVAAGDPRRRAARRRGPGRSSRRRRCAMKCSSRPLQSGSAISARQLRGSPPRSSSATRPAASGRASAREAAPIRAEPVRSPSSAGDLARSRAGSSSASSSATAAPAGAIHSALACWWRAAACGYGTRIAGRPAAAISKIEPPARASTRSAGRERVGRGPGS